MLFELFGISTTALTLVTEFLLSAIVVTYAGIRVCKYGDHLGDLMGLSKAWVGVILLATVTSVPELVGSIGAVTLIRAPNIAFGNIFGSNAFNIMIICIIDIVLLRKASLLKAVHHKHVLSAAFGIVFMSIGMCGIYLADLIPFAWAYTFSAMIAFAYLYGSKLIFEHETYHHEREEHLPLDTSHLSFQKVVLYFSFWSLVIVFAGLWLVQLSDELALYPFELGARKFILGHSFVGTVFMAIVTSLPEVVVSISAVKLGAMDMALGNIFGSNLCNMFFIPIIDVIYLFKYGVSIFTDVTKTHIFTGLLACILTAIAISGLIYRSDKKRIIEWDLASMLVIYMLGMVVLFMIR